MALAIRLPVAYRRLVVPFPIPAYARNTDTELWDDPDALIELNRELRIGYRSAAPWPEHMFAVGRDGGGSASAIDLREAEAPVWWADRCHLDMAGTAPESPSLPIWAEQHLAELRVELEEKGTDPAGPSSARDKANAAGARAEERFILAIAGIGALLVLAAWAGVKLLAP
jgi:hypothetical protein